ncbi:C45 family autoproteolytic acyltransferase/hydrolase [Lysinibacillus sp. NPDC094403]|uniref:C45 family autoproteolytic acyltransferase/hydolase n=1 Tax=Lysinibacillus sp. NPDC094403 TaxID=3390581 RepID=UPI003CFE0FE9
MRSYEELIVEVIDVRGSYYQIGLQQSKVLLSHSHPIQNGFPNLTNKTNVQMAKQLLQFHCPSLVQEMEGLAVGLTQTTDSVIKMYSGYNITFPEMGCTSFVQNGKYIRNYDFSPTLYDARLVFSNPMNGYASVGFSQQIIGRLDGMNEFGLVVGLHFVNSEYHDEGFIASTIVRILLEQCKNIEEALKLIRELPHGYCYNYSMTDQSGQSIVVEASPQKQEEKYGNPLICTNHFEATSMKEKNKKNIQGSVNRKHFLNSLVEKNLTTMATYRHFNNGNSPLFFKHYKEYFGTLHTVIYSPKLLEVIVGIGEDAEPIIISFKDYLDEALTLPKRLTGRIYPHNEDGIE